MLAVELVLPLFERGKQLPLAHTCLAHFFLPSILNSKFLLVRLLQYTAL